jgi:hypothetical protein
MTNASSILIVGKPKSSKTTFLAQFVTIARKDKSTLRFWKTPENIQPIQDAITRLRKGDEAQSTSADSTSAIKLPVSIDQHQFELNCPDYGGEQVNYILDQREMDAKWKELVESSDSWIVFIRPQSLPATFDLSNKSAQEMRQEIDLNNGPEFKISEQSSYIELLQFMCSVKKSSFQRKLIRPKLTIALTCWDELTLETTPGEYIQDHLPLLNQFIRTNWVKESIKVMGVSAQGFELNEQNKELYLDDGPEKFPFIVRESSREKINDLTLLIAESL